MAISSRHFWRRGCAQDQKEAARRWRRLIIEPFEQRQMLSPLTQLLADVNTLPGDVTVGRPIVEMNGVAYFPGKVDDGNFQLWKSDGTPSGTTLVSNVM